MFRYSVLCAALLAGPVSAAMTYEECVIEADRLNRAYLELIGMSRDLQAKSQRAYPAGASDDDPGFLLFQHMKNKPGDIRQEWRETQQVLSAYCDHLWR